MNSRQKKIIVIAICVGAVITVGWLAYFYLISFSITNVSPDENRVSRYAPIIKIDTTRTINSEAIAFDDNGSGIVDSVRAYKKAVVVNLKQTLEVGKEYTVTVGPITSNRGQKIDAFTYTFTPADDESYLSDEERTIILSRQNKVKGAADDIVVGQLPISTSDYLVRSSLESTSDGKGRASLIATIYLKPQEVDANGYDPTVAKYTAQINDALSKLEGYSKDKYPLTINVQGP